MALKMTQPGGTAECPMCKELISREAKRCPHCTSDLSENEEWKKMQESPSTAGCTSLFVLVVAVSIGAGVLIAGR